MAREIKVSPPHRSVSKDWDPIEMERFWRPVFDKYDVDKDGTIPLRDLKNALKSSGDLRHDFPDEVIDEIVEWADLNNDGVLNYNEFLRMVHAHELGEARPTFQKIVRFAALAVVPKSQQAITIRRYIEEYNCFPPPIFLLIITLIELGIYIYYSVLLKEFSATGPVPIDSVLIYDPHRRYEAWRYVTYMFIHAGAVHIFFNLLIQLILGLPLEMVHKWWRVMLVYFGGVLAGSLGSSLSDPYTYLAGASGGVYALIAAHLANVIIEVESLCKMMHSMTKARVKYESSLEYMTNSGFSQEQLNRFTDTIYNQGDLGTPRMVFGKDYAVEMNREAAINNYSSKIENLKMKLDVAGKLLSEKILEREKLRKAASEKVLEWKRRDVH